MMFSITCSSCGFRGLYDPLDIEFNDSPNGSSIQCDFCWESISVPDEIDFIYKKVYAEEQTPVLEEGTVVCISNEDHPLYNQIGIINSKKHKFYRIEFDDKKIWIPEHWIKEHEPRAHN